MFNLGIQNITITYFLYVLPICLFDCLDILNSVSVDTLELAKSLFLIILDGMHSIYKSESLVFSLYNF